MNRLNNMIKYVLCQIVLLAGLFSGASYGGDKLNIVTSLPDLASIAREIGGEHVSTFSIAKGYQEPHFVDPKPSYMIKLQQADMFIQIGLDLEGGLVPSLL